jgi:hypothetical protein
MAISSLVIVLSLAIVPPLLFAVVGWPIARRARGYTDSLELVTISLLCGQAVLFVLQCLVYIFALSERLVPFAVVVVVLVSAAVLLADVLRRRVSSPGEHAVPLLAWISLTLLTVSCSSVLAVQGLPGAVYDWFEHYSRAQIFLFRKPPDTQIGSWTFASRGPLLNALAATFMATWGTPDYWCYSVLATLLNSQVLLSMALLLRRFAYLSTFAALAVAIAILLCAPIFNWNLVFTWTKLAASHWILLSLALSLAGVERADARLVAWGIVAMALAFLTHYLAFLYALVLLPCLAYYTRTRKLSLPPLLIGTLAGCLLVGGWMLFLVSQIGLRATIYSNSTLGSYQGAGPDLDVKFESRPSRLQAMALNLAASVLPGPARTLPALRGTAFEAPDRPREMTIGTDGKATAGPGQFRPLFLISQLEGAVGWTGLALLLGAPALAIAARGGGPSFVGFWCYFVVVGIPINLWAVQWYSVSGVLNQNLQPYLCLAAVWVVSLVARWPVPLRVLAAVAWMCECGMRVVLILHFQTRELPMRWSARGVISKPPYTCDEDYLSNYMLKTLQKVVMLRDLASADGHTAAAFTFALALAGLACLSTALLLSRRYQRLRDRAGPGATA